MIRVAISMGDPCGIGPEVTIKALAGLAGASRAGFVVVGDRGVMDEAARRFGDKKFQRLWAACPRLSDPGEVSVNTSHPLLFLLRRGPGFDRLRPGRPGAREGRAAWDSLEAALELVLQGACQALVTAPVTKAALRAAGFPGPGHTDWLAARTSGRGVMMLVAGGFRVVPATVHLPLAEVSKALTAGRLMETMTVVDEGLRKWFGIPRPRIALAGLNPHAGEQGLLGREESAIILPAVKQARLRGLAVSGPYPADTLFTREARKTYDAAVCMYHDQAMIPIKTVARERAVNLTLGLPIVRTSPAHGSAPEIAWQGLARPESMAEAIKLALRFARRLPGRGPAGPR